MTMAVVVVVPADRDHPATPDSVAMAIIVGNVALHVSGATARAVILHVNPRGPVIVTCLGGWGGDHGGDSESQDGDQLFHDVVLGFTGSDEGLAVLFNIPEKSFPGLFQTFPPFPMARKPRE